MRSASSGRAKGARRTAEVGLDVVAAYQDLFRVGRKEAEIVLTDLAEYSGFYKVTPPDAGSDLMFNEGKRAVFARIFSFLRMTGEEIRELEERARHEAVTSAQEGGL